MAHPNVQTPDEARQTPQPQTAAENAPIEETQDIPETPGIEGDQPIEPILLEVFRSGWTQEGAYPEWGIDGRAFDQSYVEALCDNTMRMMRECGLKVPIVLNHPTGWLGDEQREAAEGWVLSLECRPLKDLDPMGRPELVLVAECIMEGQLRNDFEAGRLPKRSIGWCDNGRLPNGRLIGAYLQHLGLLGGRSQPAIPGLNDYPLAASVQVAGSVHVPKGFHGALYDETAWTAARNAQPVEQASKISRKLTELIKTLGSGVSKMLGAITGKLNTAATAQVEENGMDLEAIKAALQGVMDYFTNGMAALEELNMSLDQQDGMPADGEPALEDGAPAPADGEPPAAAQDMPPPEEQAPPGASSRRPTPGEIKLKQELEAQRKENEALKLQQAQDRFEELARTGQVSASRKDAFIKVASRDGLATAENYFAGDPIERPALGRVLGTTATGQGTAAELDAIKVRAAQIAREYGTKTQLYKAEKARALAIDKGLDSFFANLETPLPQVVTPAGAQ